MMHCLNLFLLAGIVGNAIAEVREPATTLPSRPPQASWNPTRQQAIALENTAPPPRSPTSHARGKWFDTLMVIMFENQDFDVALSDPHFQAFAKQGLLFTNWHAVTHPSQPNYAAYCGGDNFGMNSDDFMNTTASVLTIHDSLDAVGVSYGYYQQDIPNTGFTGFQFLNAEGANDYVRKHNPCMTYKSFTNVKERLQVVKTFDQLTSDLRDRTTPQYSFATPNMTSDAHDTNITVAGVFLNEFLPTLLDDKEFNNDRTIILITFDENGTDNIPNHILTFAIGGLIDSAGLAGSSDDTFYTHYSTLASLQANFGAKSLGRWDCGANLLSPLADIVRHTNAVLNPLTPILLNSSYAGNNSDTLFTPGFIPSPNTESKCSAGNGVLPQLIREFGVKPGTYNYTNPFPNDASSQVNQGIIYAPSSLENPEGVDGVLLITPNSGLPAASQHY